MAGRERVRASQGSVGNKAEQKQKRCREKLSAGGGEKANRAEGGGAGFTEMGRGSPPKQWREPEGAVSKNKWQKVKLC